MIAAVSVPRGASVFGFATDRSFEMLATRVIAEELVFPGGQSDVRIDVFPDPHWGTPHRDRVIPLSFEG